MKLFAPATAVALSLVASPARAQLLKGTVVAKEMPDMLINYSLDGNLMNLTSVEIEPDSATGAFTFDAVLPGGSIDASLYVNNDLFGLHLENGKQAVISLKAEAEGDTFEAEIGGDNAALSRFYNAYTRAFDTMKYFAPDPSEGKTVEEYRAILEEENAKVRKLLPTIKDKRQREYYARLTEGMYKWTKIRILMDQAFNEQKAFTDYPEYNEILSQVDPNDTLSLPTNLAFSWLTREMKLGSNGNETDEYIKGFDIVEQRITNPTMKAALTRYLPYVYFSYTKTDSTEAKRFFQRFEEFAKDDPQLVEQYRPKLLALTLVKTGGAVPYDPELTRRDGSTCHLADMKGRVVYIDVWATWCGPCCKEIPHLEKVVEQMKDNEGVRFVSVSIDENRAAWEAKLDKDQPQWEQYILTPEEQAQFMQLWGIGGIPRFIILDAEGQLVDPDAPRPSNPDLIDTLTGLAAANQQ